ncbi:NAD(P)-binding protein [Chaetoceros tenuissimus]|uniref:NAD(P)-binding protein n=1 Tax=Chaetoceros tenuissimus TaxID=426638 RepID=A0AAD3CN54_9STRA|nr:NAD(P)-binding protein [Chaetoceros tenuissimus]
MKYLLLTLSILLPITVKALYHQPKVVIFSSIQNLHSTLADLDIDIQDLYDNELESIDFDASCLKPSTFEVLKEAEILITEPKILANILEHDPDILQKLRWCQSTFAGVDAIFKSNALKAWKDSKQRDAPFPFIVTRISGCFGQPIAEWVIGRIISFERNFKLMDNNQVKRKWGENLGVLKSYRNLSDLTLVILGGCGDIGSCIAKVAKLGFAMKVIAYTKHSRIDAPTGVDECTTDLSHALKSADYLVSVLPSTPETRGLLSRSV